MRFFLCLVLLLPCACKPKPKMTFERDQVAYFDGSLVCPEIKGSWRLEAGSKKEWEALAWKSSGTLDAEDASKVFAAIPKELTEIEGEDDIEYLKFNSYRFLKKGEPASYLILETRGVLHSWKSHLFVLRLEDGRLKSLQHIVPFGKYTDPAPSIMEPFGLASLAVIEDSGGTGTLSQMLSFYALDGRSSGSYASFVIHDDWFGWDDACSAVVSLRGLCAEGGPAPGFVADYAAKLMAGEGVKMEPGTAEDKRPFELYARTERLTWADIHAADARTYSARVLPDLDLYGCGLGWGKSTAEDKQALIQKLSASKNSNERAWGLALQKDLDWMKKKR